MPTMDSLVFDTSGLTFYMEDEGAWIWVSEDGDAISLNHFREVPDLPSGPDSLAELRGLYRESLTPAGLAIIEIDYIQVLGMICVWTVFKAPQEPSGMRYLGSLTVPFASFSYVLKVQCDESGTTGIRDTAIFMKAMQSGEVWFDPAAPDFPKGWTADPYDPEFQAPLMRNLSEDPRYDEAFSEHPLSRTRRWLSHLAATLKFQPELESAAPFDFGGTDEEA